MLARTLRPIRHYLYLLAAVVTVGMLGVLAYTLYTNTQNAVAQEKNRLRTVATIIASNTAHVLEKNREVLERIARRPAIQAMDPAQCDPILVEFRALFPGFANLATVDLKGTAPCSGVPQPGGKPVSVARTEWFKRGMAERHFLAGDPFVGPITGRWVSVLLEPVWGAQLQHLGFVGLPMDLEFFDPHVSAAPLPKGTRYGIISESGFLVWRNVDPEHLVGTAIGDQPGPRRTLTVKDGEFESIGTDGVARYYSVVPIPSVHWYAYVGIESRHIDGATIRSALDNSLLALLSLSVIGALLQFLVRRITQTERELVAAKDAAQAANRAKSIFLSNMSHELRTPLNAILGFAQLMERDSEIPEQQRGNLKTIGQSGRHLLTLINDILDISKIEAGRQVYTPQVCDLPELIASLTESMVPRALGKGLALRSDLDPTLPHFINTDVGKLRQVLLNLLSNAVKYTVHGEVTLHASATVENDHTMLAIRVRDTGIGIPADELERIFDPFYQTQQGTLVGEGTGLGLAIARHNAELLGGRLQAESAPGQGSVFTLIIPARIAEEASPVVASRRHVSGLTPGQPSYRVLIAEDKESNQRLLARLLEDAGFDVRIAANGREAIEIFRVWHPHFIWMDMRMPVLDGYQATREIRKLEGGGALPIVALTASAFEEDRAGILEAGCTDMVKKPLDADQLFEVMSMQLGVTFRYAEEPLAASTKDGHLVAIDVSVLPAEIRERLRSAAESLNGEAVRAIAAEVETVDPEIAAAIRIRVEQYRFDLLVPSVDGNSPPEQQYDKGPR